MKKLLLFSILSLTALINSALAADAQTPPHSAVLSWNASATPGATYNVLRASTSAGPFTPVTGGTGVTALTFTDNGLAANTQYCYELTASAPPLADSDPVGPSCGTTSQDKASSPGTLTIIFK